MVGSVIQGYFIRGGRERLVAHSAFSLPLVAQPFQPSAFSARISPSPVQQRGTASHIQPAYNGLQTGVLQRTTNGSSPINAHEIGLMNGRGKPLPQALLSKMEAAFSTDFSAVRIHVGPQAGRIGALAFTNGNDLYFAPGQYQPDSIKGQQLIGHELAHVIQQRQGRVRGPASGVAIVQDQALELEADRLGMRAAMHSTLPQDKPLAVSLLTRRLGQQQLQSNAMQTFKSPSLKNLNGIRNDMSHGIQRRWRHGGDTNLVAKITLGTSHLNSPISPSDHSAIQARYSANISVKVDPKTILECDIISIKISGSYMPTDKNIGGKKKKNTERSHQIASAAIRVNAEKNRQFVKIKDLHKFLQENLRISIRVDEDLVKNLEYYYAAFIQNQAKKIPVYHDSRAKNQKDGRETKRAVNEFNSAHGQWGEDQNSDNEEERELAKMNLLKNSYSTPPRVSGIKKTRAAKNARRLAAQKVFEIISGSPVKLPPSWKRLGK